MQISFFDPKMSNTYVTIEGRWSEKKLFLTTAQMRMIASKNTKIISQFLEIVA